MTASRHRSARTFLVQAACLAVLVCATGLGIASPASAEFGVRSFTSAFQTPLGAPATQAGSHADMSTFIGYNYTTDAFGNDLAEGSPRDIEVDLPAGFYGNPQAAPTCTMQDIVQGEGFCSPDAQVGVLHYEAASHLFLDFPVYNLEAPDAQTAVLGVVVVSIPGKIVVSVRADGDYGLTAKLSNLNQGLQLRNTTLTLWGVPADPVHDALRFLDNPFSPGHPAGVPPRPFLSLPARCESVTTTLRTDSWQNPGVWHTASVTSPPLTGCDQLRFAPSIKARPQATTAGAPSGYDIRVAVPQDETVDGRATPQLRKAVVTLPVGTRVSPASADGLGACSDADLKLDSKAEPNCPDSAKVGTVSIDTPELKDPLVGDIILGTQRPDQLLRLFFVVHGPGLLLKIPGKVDPDPVTGQLVATFDWAPQLPFASLDTSFKGGPRAALVNPKACGTYTTHASLTPWSGGPAVEATDQFTIDKNCDQAGKFEPVMDAGVVDPSAGKSSPFVLNLTRPSGQQDFGSVTTVLPAGLLAHVGDVPLCAEAQAATGTCGTASQVGKVRVAAGAGSAPLAVPQLGKTPTAVFLAGPYKGAPYSLSIVVPAQAGPFDLGLVVVRAALLVDPKTAQVTVKSDPLPTILDGIPLDIQKVSVLIDRPGFMISPTNCSPLQVGAQVGSSEGASVDVSSRFQVADCASLPYDPKLGIDLSGKGQTVDGTHPALTAHLATNAADTNSKQVTVTLPLSLALDPGNANGLCEPVDAAANHCAASTIVGHASAHSILKDPLTGPVYFVRGERTDASGRVRKTLPKLFIPLSGDGVTIYVNASSDVKDDRLVTVFDNLPDAPFSSFDLQIDGGKHGILAVSGKNVCAATQVADADFSGQSGKTVADEVTMGTPCTLGVSQTSHTSKTLNVTISGLSAGKVSVTGKGLTRASRTISGTPVATVAASLSTSVRSRLAHGHDVKVKLSVSFTAKGAKKVKKVTKTITIHGAKKK
jgi:hypothetical protein